MAKWSIAIITAAVGLCLTPVNGAPTLDPVVMPQPTMPPDWMGIAAPSDAQRGCANLSSREWRVSVSGNSLDIAPDQDGARDRLPFKVTVPPREISEIGDRYGRHVLKVDNGWLVGFDNGEWDGSLWWFSNNGKKAKKLAGYSESAWRSALASARAGKHVEFPRAGNVHGIVQLAHGVLAFIGLAHMMTDQGAVVRIDEDSRGSWKVTDTALLDGEPEAISAGSSDDAIVVTNKTVWHATSAGVLRKLDALDTSSFYVNSVTTPARGRIFIGMRQYIVQLTQASTNYEAQWFAPNDCPTLTRTDIDKCRCVGAPGASPYIMHQLSHHNYPQSLTRGDDGSLWFAEGLANRIGHIAPDGTISEREVPKVSDSGIAVTPGANVWFASGQTTISRLTPDGTRTDFEVPSFSGYTPIIESIIPAADGGIWFSDLDKPKIVHLAPSGQFTPFEIHVEGFVQVQLALGDEGNVWFTGMNNNTIGRLSPNGNITVYHPPTHNGGPIQPTRGPDGFIWFYESKAGQLARLSTGGGAVREFPLHLRQRMKLSPGTVLLYAGPQALAISAEGTVWFAQTDSDRIGRLDVNGTVKYFPLPHGSAPTSLAVGADGGVWFTEQLVGKIGRLDSSGAVREFTLPSYTVTRYQ